MTKKKFTDADSLFNKTSDGKEIKKEKEVQEPTQKELDEVVTPELSTDFFTIADKTFQIRLSNIKTQKRMSYALDSINNLIEKIDVRKVFDKVRTTLEGYKEEGNKPDEYLDMVDLAKAVLHEGGIGTILVTIIDLYVGIVFAICQSQDKTVTRDWVEENIDFNKAQYIFFKQLKKDQLGGRVVDFLAVLTRLLTGKSESSFQSS